MIVVGDYKADPIRQDLVINGLAEQHIGIHPMTRSHCWNYYWYTDERPMFRVDLFGYTYDVDIVRSYSDTRRECIGSFHRILLLFLRSIFGGRLAAEGDDACDHHSLSVCVAEII